MNKYLMGGVVVGAMLLGSGVAFAAGSLKFTDSLDMGINGKVVKVVDSTNNVTCYTYTNTSGLGGGISCVRF
jgi:hypothetical protein